MLNMNYSDKYVEVNYHSLIKIALICSIGMELLFSSLVAICYAFEIDRFAHQAWLSKCFLILTVLALWVAFIHHSSINSQKVILSQLLLLTITMGFIIGGLSYLAYFIEATYVDPEFSQKSLEVSRRHWLENNYSDEAIAGQVELSESFHNPAKWGFFSGLFIMSLTLFIGIIMASLRYLFYKSKNIDTKVLTTEGGKNNNFKLKTT